jgi:hypothetical protein
VWSDRQSILERVQNCLDSARTQFGRRHIKRAAPVEFLMRPMDEQPRIGGIAEHLFGVRVLRRLSVDFGTTDHASSLALPGSASMALDTA